MTILNFHLTDTKNASKKVFFDSLLCNHFNFIFVMFEGFSWDRMFKCYDFLWQCQSITESTLGCSQLTFKRFTSWTEFECKIYTFDKYTFKRSKTSFEHSPIPTTFECKICTFDKYTFEHSKAMIECLNVWMFCYWH